MRLRLNAFIVTLAMLILLRGVQLGITNGKTLFDLPPEFLYLGSANWLGVPVSIWIAGVLYLVVRPVPALPPASAARSTRSAATPRRPAPPASGSSGSRGPSIIVGGMLAALAGLMLDRPHRLGRRRARART